jgi:hypothetical protein
MPSGAVVMDAVSLIGSRYSILDPRMEAGRRHMWHDMIYCMDKIHALIKKCILHEAEMQFVDKIAHKHMRYSPGPLLLSSKFETVALHLSNTAKTLSRRQDGQTENVDAP